MYEKYDKETMEWRVDSMLSAAQRGKDLTEKLSLIYAMYQECSDKVNEEWQPQGDKSYSFSPTVFCDQAYTGPNLTDKQQLTLREAESLLKRELSLLRRARNYNDAH